MEENKYNMDKKIKVELLGETFEVLTKRKKGKEDYYTFKGVKDEINIDGYNTIVKTKNTFIARGEEAPIYGEKIECRILKNINGNLLALSRSIMTDDVKFIKYLGNKIFLVETNTEKIFYVLDDIFTLIKYIEMQPNVVENTNYYISVSTSLPKRNELFSCEVLNLSGEKNIYRKKHTTDIVKKIIYQGDYISIIQTNNSKYINLFLKIPLYLMK